ncbi:hypothetical protein MNEG_15687 [Monoraphidium neglectum]|uniref:Aminotransferase class I/classII domain-containing protein n=1 Tax=Monoraphidium neglectum TaxID=145388 RepID=A0A0D2IWE2_9CHLO|nr:hypothetical protein MNEG_15687 [Monoraphidium neglectum]KIY92277.1 hypothetical protein MNEG_15687 [Monoraphidium neglectum]|eukprot:XP_013891297.1 hypothetical protein MNEG_15687 [Monoraphidium neglectum]
MEAAAARGKNGDWLYCLELLESTGIVVVPGSGFGQAEGSLHFRWAGIPERQPAGRPAGRRTLLGGGATTFLPPEEDIMGVVEKLGAFHANFLKKYGGLPPAPANGL